MSENSHAERIEAQLRMAEDEADEEDGGEPSVSIDLTDVPTGRDSTHVALVSGGMDSTVAAAVSQEVARKLDVLAYLDTGTGLEANREHIEELADALGLQLWTLRTHESYAEKVRENGYPGPSRHGMMYNFLKERQISKLATVSHGDLVLWTGVRSHESERRMAHVEGVQEARRWTWVAPIHDWTKQDCQDYLDAHDLPENPLWKTLGRSRSCFSSSTRPCSSWTPSPTSAAAPSPAPPLPEPTRRSIASEILSTFASSSSSSAFSSRSRSFSSRSRSSSSSRSVRRSRSASTSS